MNKCQFKDCPKPAPTSLAQLTLRPLNQWSSDWATLHGGNFFGSVKTLDAHIDNIGNFVFSGKNWNALLAM